MGTSLRNLGRIVLLAFLGAMLLFTAPASSKDYPYHICHQDDCSNFRAWLTSPDCNGFSCDLSNSTLVVDYCDPFPNPSCHVDEPITQNGCKGKCVMNPTQDCYIWWDMCRRP